MNKSYVRIMIFVLLTSTVFLQGCAMDKPFVKKDMTSISPLLNVVRYETPRMTEETLGRVLTGAILFGGIGAAVAASMVEAKKPIDFGELIMKKFIERGSKEIPNWPLLTIEEQPVAEEYSFQSGNLLEFKVSELRLHSIQGLITSSTATMKKYDGNVLWQKSFRYRSKKYDRGRSIDEFKADNSKLLKEEMDFAAEKTISDFIEHFKGGK